MSDDPSGPERPDPRLIEQDLMRAAIPLLKHRNLVLGRLSIVHPAYRWDSASSMLWAATRVAAGAVGGEWDEVVTPAWQLAFALRCVATADPTHATDMARRLDRIDDPLYQATPEDRWELRAAAALLRGALCGDFGWDRRLEKNAEAVLYWCADPLAGVAWIPYIVARLSPFEPGAEAKLAAGVVQVEAFSRNAIGSVNETRRIIDAITHLVPQAALPQDVPPNQTKPMTTMAPKSPRKNVDARMLKALATDPARLAWTIQMWADHLGCAQSSIHATPTWKKHIPAMRDTERRSRAAGHRGHTR